MAAQFSKREQWRIGRIPHTIAYIKGHKTIVEFLKNAGATSDYDEIMLAAAVEGLLDIVKESLKKNVNVNVQVQYFDDNTALHLASLNGHTEVVQFLLQSNADPNISNKWGHSPLYLAHWYKHDNIVKLLCSFGARDMDQVRNDDLLLTSAENGNIETLTQALTSGANVNVHHHIKEGLTPAHLAAMNGHVDVLKLLITVGQADINATDYQGQTPAHCAAEKGHVDVLKLLIEEGQADINVTDIGGVTPAHLAAMNGHVDVLKLLITVGQADINVAENQGLTPAHLAAMNGHVDVQKLLITVGQADINVTDDEHSINELSDEHKSDTLPSNTTQQAPAKRKRSFSHSTSKKLKQSDNTDNDQLETNPGSLKRKHSSNFNSDDLPNAKKYVQEQQESNVRGCVTQADKNTIDDQTDEHAMESSAVDSTQGSITDNLSMEHQHYSTNELSSEHKPDTLPSNTTQQGTIDPSEIFLDYFADICDAIEVKPLSIVNRLYTARLISLIFKKDVESMSGDNYDKANKVVNELQQQVDEKGIEFLKALCDFLLKQNQELKDIGTRMKSQLEA